MPAITQQTQADIDAAGAKAETAAKTKFWAGLLMTCGALLVVGAAALAIYSSTLDVKTVVTGKDDPATTRVEDSTTTVTSARVADSLVTTTLAAGAVMLLAGAFYRRVSKIVITGIGEIDLSTEGKVVEEAAKAANGDPDKTAKIATLAIRTLRAEDQRVRVADRWNLGRHDYSYFRQPAAPAPVDVIDEQAIRDAVTAARDEVG